MNEFLQNVVIRRVLASTRQQWLALVVFWLLLGALLLAGLWHERQDTLQAERNRLAGQAKVVQENMVQQLAAVDAVLTAMQADLGRLDGLAEHPEITVARLGTLVQAMPGVRTLSVFDANGTLLASNRLDFLGQNFAHREYFQSALAVNNPATLWVSQPFKTVLGVYSIALAKVQFDQDTDRLHRVLVATLEPAFFETLLGSVLYADDMWVGLAHQDGLLVVVQPNPDRLVGADLNQTDAFQLFKRANQNQTLYEGFDPFSGNNAIKVLQDIRLPANNMPKHLVLGVTRSTAAVLAPWQSRARLVGMVWLAVGLLMGFSLWLTQQHSGKVNRLMAEQDQFRQQVEDEIRQLAFYDPLTHLPNRRLLMDRLPLCQAASLRHGRYSALFFIDLDNFKTLNDTHGHSAGDELLVQVAQRLQACVREEDTVARMGGDEFVLMLPELGTSAKDARQAAEAVARKVLAALSDRYQLSDIDFGCSGSVGITLFGYRTESVDEVLDRADNAMYAAKWAGRNTYRLADEDLPATPQA